MGRVEAVMGRTGKAWALASLAACIVSTAALPGPADAARVTVGKLVLQADGGFAPRQLPRRTYAPISFQGHAEIKMKDGTVPPAVERIRLDFDRDGRLTTGGLAICHPEQIQGVTTEQARSRCGAAQVGSGTVEATAELPFAGRLNVRAPLTIFNGPRQGRAWTVLAHAQTDLPLPETHVVVIPVERRSGTYGYRATFDLPPILGGFGSLTHIDAKIGRRYRVASRERSYISARCSDGILQTQGYASFANGDVISGSLFKYCTAID